MFLFLIISRVCNYYCNFAMFSTYKITLMSFVIVPNLPSCGTFDLFTSHIYLPLNVSCKWNHTSFLLPSSFIYHNVFKVDLCIMSLSAFQSYKDILPHIYRMSPVSISQLMDICASYNFRLLN